MNHTDSEYVRKAMKEEIMEVDYLILTVKVHWHFEQGPLEELCIWNL